MTPGSPAITLRVAVLGLVATAVFSVGRGAVEIAQTWRVLAPTEEVTAYEQRFRQIRNLLPRHGVVGYLSDRMDAVKEYYLTQYALAPVVVHQSPDHDLVVGNFFKAEAAPRLLAAHGLVVARDFGEGLMLLRRRR